MDKHELEKVPPDSKERCQNVNPLGQCLNKVIPNADYCPIHISAHRKGLKANERRIYNLTKWRDQVHRHADNPRLTNLSEELGILRMLMENYEDIIKTPMDMVMYSNQISELVTKIQRLVKDLHSLEKATGNLLDKSAAIKIAGDIVEIIATHITDSALLEVISSEIIEKVLNALPSEIDG